MTRHLLCSQSGGGHSLYWRLLPPAEWDHLGGGGAEWGSLVAACHCRDWPGLQSTQPPGSRTKLKHSAPVTSLLWLHTKLLAHSHPCITSAVPLSSTGFCFHRIDWLSKLRSSYATTLNTGFAEETYRKEAELLTPVIDRSCSHWGGDHLVLPHFWKVPSSTVPCAAEICSDWTPAPYWLQQTTWRQASEGKRERDSVRLRQREREDRREMKCRECDDEQRGFYLTASKWFCPPDPLKYNNWHVQV